MIYEYALDPKEVATWGNEDKYQVVIEAFGCGTPRISARMPKKWEQQIKKAFSKDEEEYDRLIEVIEAISEHQTHRPAIIPKDEDWLEGAHNEHKSNPFCAIISDRKINPHNAYELTFDDIFKNHETWKLDDQIEFTRDAAGFAETFAPMLSISENIKIVDPPFRPEADRFKNVYRELLGSKMAVSAENVKVQIFCQEKDTRTNPSWEVFENRLASWPEKVIPRNMSVEFIRLQEIGPARLHNRYIMTDFGGAQLLDSFDEEENPEEDGGHASLMRRRRHARTWKQYSAETSDFNVENSITLIGQMD